MKEYKEKQFKKYIKGKTRLIQIWGKYNKKIKYSRTKAYKIGNKRMCD
jgi:hypothetical protein